MKNVFITGNSRGLGQGFTEVLLNHDYHIYSCSRQGCPIKNQHITDIHCDLSNLDNIHATLANLLTSLKQLDLIILNAGMLGEIKPMQQTSIAELEHIMTRNVWSNKVILDYFLQSEIQVRQILLISSGAAMVGNKGWGGYALSKSSLNMLARLYAQEFSNSHIISIAPGMIETAMMDYLCNEVDSQEYSALQRIHSAREQGKVVTPYVAAERIIQALPELEKIDSGEYIDIRQIVAADEYAELMKSRPGFYNTDSKKPVIGNQ